MTALIVMLLPNCYCGDFSAILYVYIEGEGVTNSKVILLLLSPIAEVGGVSTNKSGIVTKVDAKNLLLLHVLSAGKHGPWFCSRPKFWATGDSSNQG
jgi:hypothetical protein